MQEETFGGTGYFGRNRIICKLLQYNRFHEGFLKRVKLPATLSLPETARLKLWEGLPPPKPEFRRRGSAALPPFGRALLPQRPNIEYL